MIITVDRQDGTFTPQMSDRINIKSQDLWEKIQNLTITSVYPKLKVDTSPINTINLSFVSSTVDSSFVIDGHLYVINVSINFNTSISASSFYTIGRLNVPPNVDIIQQYDDGNYIIKVDKGSQEIKVLGSVGTSCAFYFYYII